MPPPSRLLIGLCVALALVGAPSRCTSYLPGKDFVRHVYFNGTDLVRARNGCLLLQTWLPLGGQFLFFESCFHRNYLIRPGQSRVIRARDYEISKAEVEFFNRTVTLVDGVAQHYQTRLAPHDQFFSVRYPLNGSKPVVEHSQNVDIMEFTVRGQTNLRYGQLHLGLVSRLQHFDGLTIVTPQAAFRVSSKPFWIQLVPLDELDKDKLAHILASNLQASQLLYQLAPTAPTSETSITPTRTPTARRQTLGRVAETLARLHSALCQLATPIAEP